MTDFSSMFTWVDESDKDATYGDGISHAMPGAPTLMYALTVYLPGARPMAFSLPAESLDKAIEYAKARWPSARVLPQSTK